MGGGGGDDDEMPTGCTGRWGQDRGRESNGKAREWEWNNHRNDRWPVRDRPYLPSEQEAATMVIEIVMEITIGRHEA